MGHCALVAAMSGFRDWLIEEAPDWVLVALFVSVVAIGFTALCAAIWLWMDMIYEMGIVAFLAPFLIAVCACVAAYVMRGGK